MDNLRPPNTSSELLVDPGRGAPVDPSINFIGMPRPLRRRLLYALPLSPGPALLRPATVIRDPATAQVADPQAAIVGREAIRVSRLATALPMEDSRGFGYAN